MQAVVTAPRAAQTHNLHRAGGRFGVAIVLAPRRALDPTGVLGRTGSLSRAALVVMSLQELAYQLLAPPVQFPFEFALAHLPGFVGGEEGFGIREDSIGRCARDRAREIANYVVMQAEINIPSAMTRLRRISVRCGVNARMASPDTAASPMPTSCARIWWLTAYLTAWKRPKSATTTDS